MITVLIADNLEKVKEIVAGILCKEGNVNLYISKQANTIRLAKNNEIKDAVSFEDKVVEMIESLHREKRGMVYKYILEQVERLLFEHILERVDGNQLKAAKILGINRNTMHSKIRKLEIDVRKYKY